MKVRKSNRTLESTKRAESKMLKCDTCDDLVKVGEDIISVLCWKCCLKKTEPPMVKQATTKIEGPKRPRGWHLMKVYVDSDKNVYHEGVEKPELKGTLPITPIKPKKTKAQKDAEAEKKEARLVKLYKKKQVLKANGINNTSVDANSLQKQREE